MIFAVAQIAVRWVVFLVSVFVVLKMIEYFTIPE